MTDIDALLLIDDLLHPQRLTHIQQIVFSQSWVGRTYSDIASQSGYAPDYIKIVGSQLWQDLSEAIGEKVTKKNVESVLRQYRHRSDTRISDFFWEYRPVPDAELEFPGGPVPLFSKFYVDRPPLENLARAELCKPGALIRIKAPQQMGKTSLMHRLLAFAKEKGFRTVSLSLDRADSEVWGDRDRFLRWFCANLSRQLDRPSDLDLDWDADMGSNMSCTFYLQERILDSDDTPLVLALDEVNRVFEHDKIANNFLPLLRSWHEEAGELDVWQKLRTIVVHTTEVYVPLNLAQSPFNVGLPLQLPELTPSQVQDLALRHGLDWAAGATGIDRLEPLIATVGGHPYLIRLALYHLARRDLTFRQLVQEAPTLGGIYDHYLRRLLDALARHPNLTQIFRQVIATPEGIELEAVAPSPGQPTAIAVYELESLGLVTLAGNRVFPSCALYRLYFQQQLR